MKFEISQAIEDYVSSQGRVFLNACPGSGKTTTVAYKLFVRTANWERTVGRYYGIACLSFTNIAKDEINQKYAEFSREPLRFPHLVSTIDSFINRYITLPFFYLFQPDAERPRIVEEHSVINTAWERNPQAQRFRNKKNQPTHYSYPPYDIQIELDGSFTYKGIQPNPDKVDVKIFNDYCRTVKKWQIRERGILTMTDSAYIAACLLKKHPRIAKWLAARFPVIIVDEAQDTSEIQFSILQSLADAGLVSLELVGDPYQCLYEWRNAQPDLLLKETQDGSKWVTLHLNDCRRSHSKIIQCYSIFRTDQEPEINPVTPFETEYPVLVVRYSPSVPI